MKIVTNLISAEIKCHEAVALFAPIYTYREHSATRELIYFRGPLITEPSLLIVTNLIPIRVHRSGEPLQGAAAILIK